MLQYLNTDLVLCSDQNHAELIDFLASKGFIVLWSDLSEDGFWWSNLEIDDTLHNPEATIMMMLSVLDHLPEPQRLIWDGLLQRTLDIGYESGTEPRSMTHDLSVGTLKRIAALDTAIKITLYAM